MTESLEREAHVFSRYLLGVSADPTVLALYARGSALLPDRPGGRDARIVAFACRYPRLIGPLDGALALRDPESLLRRKLHLLSAILEARPAHAAHFLPRSRPVVYALAVAYFGGRAVLKAAAGMLLLPLVK